MRNVDHKFITISGQQITECVIVVPGYFGQAERSALLSAANIANLKVLQLINDYTAVALNYGIFQRAELNETAQYFVFYDMGAYKTSAAVVSYQLVKDKITRDTNPVIQVLGVGYDRTLGGLEMQIRLRDYLAAEFNKLKKTPTDVFTSPRALAKLFKEAGRLKKVLSANQDHFAQIEGLLDDKDFKHQVTRETFENLCSDLFERVTAPLERALKSSGLGLDVISQVTLFGGGARVPKVQEVLKAYVKTELGKNINMDEAATMGAVYKAADLATGFKVKKFVTKDAVLFPIQVTFEREGSSGATKLVRRNLFTAMNLYPQKKVITFNKNTEDFHFHVNYADLQHLPEQEISNLGKLNLSKIALSEIAQTYEDNKGENVEAKGIKAHFHLDESGLLSVSGVEAIFERTGGEPEEEGTLSKLGSTISKLFTSGDDDANFETVKDEPSEPTKEESGKDEEAQKEPATPEEKLNEDAKPVNATDIPAATNTTIPDAAANKTEEKPKVVTIKKAIPNQIELLHTVPLNGDSLEASKKKVSDWNEVERQKVRRETALNALESYVIDAQQKLDDDEYASCGSETEIETVRKACSEVSDWLYEDGENADAETYEKKLQELQEHTSQIYARHWEHNERPDALKALGKMLDGSKGFLGNARNFTKEANPEKDVFTPIEIDSLDKIITETEEWRDSEIGAQKKLKKYESVRLTVKSVTDKMGNLDREVKYLVNKLKIWRPKAPPPPPTVEPGADDATKSKKKKKASKKAAGNDTVVEEAADAENEETDDTVAGKEENVIEEPLEAPATDEVPVAATDDKETPSPSKAKDADPDHSEL